MINKVILIGNLGKDPEVRRFDNGSMVAKFSVATNENYQDKSGEWQKITEWHDIVCWRALAERAEKQLRKGNQVYVEGKLTHRKYQDQNGVDRYITEVSAVTFRLLEKREMGGSFPNQEYPGTAYVANNDSTATTAPETTSSNTKTEEFDDDLPF